MKTKNSKSVFTWIEGGSLNSRAYRELQDQLVGAADENKEPIDELRLDPLVDTYADHLFPWLTVLIHEPRYYFLAPAMVDAITLHLRRKNVGTWNARAREEAIRRELRFLESCVCEALCERPNGASVVGARVLKQLWGKRNARVTRQNVIEYGGIQKSFGMQVVPRYLGRACRLFTGENSSPPVLDLIEEGVAAPTLPTFWWHEASDVNRLVAPHRDKFEEWLSGQANRTLTATLSNSEYEVLNAHLFGGGSSKDFAQSFLYRVRGTLLKEFNNSNPVSHKVLLRLKSVSLPNQRPYLEAAARVVCAAGNIRFLYDLLLSENYGDTDLVWAPIKRLAKLKVPKVYPVELGGFARDAVSFIRKCIEVSGQSRAPELLAVEIYKRERSIKGDRAKLYHSSGKIRPRKDARQTDGEPEIPTYWEPRLRLGNAAEVLRKVTRLRRVK